MGTVKKLKSKQSKSMTLSSQKINYLEFTTLAGSTWIRVIRTCLSLNGLASKWSCVFLSLVLNHFQGHWRLHVSDTSLNRNNKYVRIIVFVSYFLNKHLVTVPMPISAKEPSCMHINAPRSLISSHEVAKFILLSSVSSVEVFHQQSQSLVEPRHLAMSIRDMA